MKRLVALALMVFASPLMAEIPHVNWENHPIHAVDLSPDGKLLAVTHTADARVQLFDVSEGLPAAIGHIPVGIDPVSVRFRNNDELWVVNHLSDSISIIDVASRSVTATLATADEPFDVVFAGNPQRAWVSSSQTNTIQRFNPGNLNAAPLNIEIAGEDPRALAVSHDGMQVYAAVFESGNASTILAGTLIFSAIDDASGPYAGANPPPNTDQGFLPPLNPDLGPLPRVGQIVRKNANDRWLDGNGADWTAFVSGNKAEVSGRIQGWDLADNDLAVIDTATQSVTYVSGLMTMGMALGINPNSGAVSLVGTDARNEIRFEPNVRGIFARVLIATVTANNLQAQVSDLNPHLDYTTATVSQNMRNRSLGDPRAVVWNSSGTRAYVAGMGSNNVVELDQDGRTGTGQPIEVGEGPVGLALSADEQWLYVWNHFEASLSTVSIAEREEHARLSAFNPLPPAILDGRRHFYGTHETSGLGQVACASCHVDARTDRLAWDLGDPSVSVKPFNQNCSTTLARPCRDFHPLKGPMLTQTLQDIIGKEPLHWRGDRDGLEEFNPAFIGLQGDNQALSAGQMQEFEDFLASVTLPPNPYRNLDNSLSTEVDLTTHTIDELHTAGGQAITTGDAVHGLDLFFNGRLVELGLLGPPTECRICHSLPTGLGVNGPVTDIVQPIVIGGSVFPTGPNGENHLSVVSQSTLQGTTMKVPQLRTLHERTGADFKSNASRAGFGFLHDGTVGSLVDFIRLEDFLIEDDREAADMLAFLISFGGSDLPPENDAHNVPPPESNDTHAAVGQQETFPGGDQARLDSFVSLARDQVVDLVAHQVNGIRNNGWVLDPGPNRFIPNDDGNAITRSSLLGMASGNRPITFTVVPAGLGSRLGIDRDADGIGDKAEYQQGSDPADADSVAFQPFPGNWFNAARSGHGIDLQVAGSVLVITWYTYEDDGTAVWYQAVGEYQGMSFAADLTRFTWNGNGVDGETVGSLSMSFSSARAAEFCWELGDREGCEPFALLEFSEELPLRNYTSLWNDPGEIGYGLSIVSQGSTRLVVVFFYDDDDQPRWVIGAGDNALSNTIDLTRLTGFCPDCTHSDPVAEDGGEISLSFAELTRSATATLAADSGNGVWSRQGVPMRPLTQPPVDYGK